ncbi:hypothetical protein BFJ63_vAg7393 [Fusarium oxysporum f. sp. narcissi]|uniref:Uncharacterized protein n=1 Tax=Fusarium oxysporum f. sp. narcissi TaxID=451672 RepID=A0A4Q2VSW1_FUSOX|nr:hypothetical protein BFJ63_vAg7393 [Fusarium oxysporum f. sp. narcissi]
MGPITKVKASDKLMRDTYKGQGPSSKGSSSSPQSSISR